MALTKAQEDNAERNRQYWKDREDEALKHRITDEKEYDKRLKQIYQSQLDAIQKEIDAFYGKYATKNGITIAEAKKRVSKADMATYKFKAKRYVKEKNFTPQANEEMALYNLTMKVNRLEMLKASIGLELLAGGSELENFMADILKGRTMDELKRQAGILGKTIQNNAKTANAIVNASFHNATFSNRIWLYQDLLRADLDKILQSGLIQGKNPRVLAREIKDKFNTSTYNAERLMRTELARVQTEAQKQSFEKNGFEEYTFIVNGGCCDICESIKDKHFKVKDMQPGENAPPMHPHCRCSTAAYEDSEEYERWLDFLANGGTTEEYNKLKAQPKAKQEESKTTFTPAKTIAEAEEYVKQFVDDKQYFALGVSYKGIDVKVANEINRAFAKVFNMFNVDKFGGIIAPAGNTRYGKIISGAMAGYNPTMKSFLINRNDFKNMKTAQIAFEKEKSMLNDLLYHPEKYDFTKMSNQTKNLIERARISGRTTVPESIEEAIMHEIGHMLEKKVYATPEWAEAETNMKKYADKISAYAGTKKSEYVAESFASYMKGETIIDPVMESIFESLKR